MRLSYRDQLHGVLGLAFFAISFMYLAQLAFVLYYPMEPFVRKALGLFYGLVSVFFVLLSFYFYSNIRKKRYVGNYLTFLLYGPSVFAISPIGRKLWNLAVALFLGMGFIGLGPILVFQNHPKLAAGAVMAGTVLAAYSIALLIQIGRRYI